MTQLVCNNVRLDLYDDVSLQFVHENPLFAFDKLSCERTTQFKLPSTPVNDRVLALARIPAYKGVGMRRKLDCVLQEGVCVSRGYLYISAYDGTDYNAVFVTGDLIGLQAIKNLGKLEDIVSYNNVLTYGAGGHTPAAGVGFIWDIIFYKRPNDQTLRPSIELASLYNDICTRYGITAQSMPAGASGVRIIPNEVKGLKEQTLTIKRIMTGAPAQGSNPQISTNTITVPELFVASLANISYRQEVGGNINVYTGRVAQLQVKQALTLKFPDDWDDDLFVGGFQNGGTYVIGEFQFYGERSFDEDGAVTGDSLAGRSVEIPLNSYLTIISKLDYFKGTDSGGSPTQGWFYTSGGYYELEISAIGSVEAGAYVRLQDNLPDMTFTELLKVIAAISGLVLNYDDENGLTFEQLNVATYPQKALGKLTERGEVQRTFADYAQNNIVRFDDETADRLIVDYTIDNDNIAYEQDLQVLPFSEGMRDGDYIFIPSEGEHPYLGINNGGAYLGRVALPQNTGLQTLCTASTQFKLSARMSMYEYTKLAAKTLLLVDGSLYVWTKKEWSKDVVKLTLARI